MFLFGLGVFGLFLFRFGLMVLFVPPRIARMHGRDDTEVVFGRRIVDRPLEGAAIPIILLHLLTLEKGVGEHGKVDEHAEAEDVRANRREEVWTIPSQVWIVGKRAARHAVQP